MDVVLKIASRCNLNCTYCNYFNHVDQSYRRQSPIMPPEVFLATARRLQEYVASTGEPVNVVLHGGEPLLLGQSALRDAVVVLRGHLGKDCPISVQTNGVLLDSKWVHLFDELGVRVGVSIDGPAAFHDRRRVDHSGRPTHAATEAAIVSMLSSQLGRRVFGGTISVADLTLPPEHLYAYLRGLGVQNIEVLLPDANWDQPPLIGEDSEVGTYGEYLVRLLEAWLSEDDPTVGIGVLDACLRAMGGAQVVHEYWGLEPQWAVVIEPDGSIEAHDALRTCAEGLVDLGLNVMGDPIVRLFDAPILKYFTQPAARLSPACLPCEWVQVCGGGMPAHRFSQGGFDNPSVYCADLKHFLAYACAIFYPYQARATPADPTAVSSL